MADVKKRPKIDAPFETDAEVEAMVERFEQLTWPYERWTHRCHLAVAVVFLSRFGYDEAVERVRRGIDRYNRERGDPDGYHETITLLFLRRVAADLRDRDGIGLARRVEELSHVLTSRWPLAYYSAERLWSDEARRGWVDPDLRELDF